MEKQNKKLMDYFQNASNTKEITDPDGTGSVSNLVYGDAVELRIKVKDGVITDAAFKAFGCKEAVASCSYIVEMIRNKTVAEAENITAKDIADELGLEPERMRCSVLAEQVLQKAINNYKARKV